MGHTPFMLFNNNIRFNSGKQPSRVLTTSWMWFCSFTNNDVFHLYHNPPK